MKRHYEKDKTLAMGKDVYIGMDVHKESWQVSACIDGKEVFYGSMPSEYRSLQELLEHFRDCRVKVAYEAGPFGFCFHDKLVADGIETIKWYLLPSYLWNLATGSIPTSATAGNLPICWRRIC